MRADILVFFVLLVISHSFDLSYFRVCCIVSCIGYHLFLLIGSHYSPFVVLFILTTV
jgi:hypothetical protein